MTVRDAGAANQSALHLVLRLATKPVEVVSRGVQAVSPDQYWDMSATEAVVCTLASAVFASLCFITASTTPLALLYTAMSVSGVLTVRWLVNVDTPAARSCRRCLSVTADIIRVWDCVTSILSLCFKRGDDRRYRGAAAAGIPVFADFGDRGYADYTGSRGRAYSGAHAHVGSAVEMRSQYLPGVPRRGGAYYSDYAQVGSHSGDDQRLVGAPEERRW